MNLQNVKIVHDVLIEVMDVSTDIDSAGKPGLKSEVNVNESSRV